MPPAVSEKDGLGSAATSEPATRRNSTASDSDSSHDADSIRPVERAATDYAGLDRTPTHQSMGPDAPAVELVTSVAEIPDEVYDRFPPHRKIIIVALLSFCAFLAPISSTSVLSATPEVAAEYNTTGTVINLVNALYMLFMGFSPILWGPMAQVYGRRPIAVVTSAAFVLCSVGTALAPDLVSFFVFRLLTALEGTAFILIGSAVISDIYRPVERGTATGWFLSGTLIGPALGPFVGGIIVTYQSWRVIFWLQTALAGVACVGAFFLLPETIYHRRIDDLEGYAGMKRARVVAAMINPWRVLALFAYPNLLLVGFSSACLVWNMYSLLTPIRYVLNPRFGLTTPMQGGLFYLAPGLGYLVGTLGGGRFADWVVRRYIRKRGGVRVPEDRLYSSLPFMGVAIPVCVLLYGWGIDKDVGGIPLAVVTLFVQGVAQLFCFPSLNTYCLDVMPARSAEVIAGNYGVRYLLACVGTAVVLPGIEAMGIGWFSTISTLLVLSGAASTLATILYGKGWRDAIDARRREHRRRDVEKRLLESGMGGVGVDDGVVRKPKPVFVKEV